MIRRAIVTLICMVLCASLSFHQTVSALGLKVAPLEYREELSKGEMKKGFIDISNPTGLKLDVSSKVQAFRQIDNSGALEFYDDDRVKEGVALDLDSFELGPREAIRMYFLVDGTKLPSGNVFAGVLFTGKTESANGINQSVNVGTLLSIQNGTASDQSAKLTSLKIPVFQFSGNINGTYGVKNTADPMKSTGFYPGVTISSSPFGDEITKQSSLVFAGRERTNDFTIEGSWSPIVVITAKTGSSSQSQVVVMAIPSISLAVGLIGLGLVGLRIRRKNHGHTKSRPRRIKRR